MALANAINASQTGFQSQTSVGIWNGRTLTAGTGISITNGDGISGNPTISASPSPSGESTIFLFDDFLGFSNLTIAGNGNCGNTNITQYSNSSGDTTQGPASSSNPGQMQFIIGTSGDRASLVGDPSSNGFMLGNGTQSIEWYSKINTLSDGAQSFLVRIGFFDNHTTTTTFNRGAWMEYTHSVNSGNWTLNTKDSVGTTSVNSSTAADTDWHNYKVEVSGSGTSAAFFIDGVELANSPITTHIPTSESLTFGIYARKTNGSTDRTIYHDFYRFIWNLAITR